MTITLIGGNRSTAFFAFHNRAASVFTRVHVTPLLTFHACQACRHQ